MSIFNIILYLLIGFSLIGLAIIIYRKVPSLANLSKEEMVILGRKKGIIERLREIDFKQHWLNFIISLEKFLRRLKIVFLKVENLLNRWIVYLRNRSQIMSQKSKEWVKQKEAKRRRPEKEEVTHKTRAEIPVRIKKEESEVKIEQDEDEDEISLSELKKPIQEEQKWIDLIIENPKNITAYKFLGLLYWKQHNYADAKASLETAVRYGSKDKKVKEILKQLKGMEIK